MEGESSDCEPIQLLELSEELLRRRDFASCRNYALRVVESDPNLAIPANRILAVADVLIAAQHCSGGDLYSILRLEPGCADRDLIRTHFKKLLLLVNPNKNKSSFAEEAFDHVLRAWSIFNPSKVQYDAETQQKHLHSQQESPGLEHTKEETKASGGGNTFWTVCPYCFCVYEYDRVYEECCLKCQNCRRAFDGVAITPPPSAGAGKNQYYCCLGFFPLGYATAENGEGRGVPASVGFSPMFPDRSTEAEKKNSGSWEHIDSDDYIDISEKVDGELETKKEGGNSSDVNLGTMEEKQSASSMDRHERSEPCGSGSLTPEVPDAVKPPLKKRKTVARNTKKIMGRGIKGNKHENIAFLKARRLKLNGRETGLESLGVEYLEEW